MTGLVMKEVMDWLAVELFGRQHSERSPDEQHWCRTAEDDRGDKFAGPWFKYEGDKSWQCELCYTDHYLNEYGDKYLLNGAGMRAVLEAMAAKGIDYVQMWFVATMDPTLAWQCEMRAPWMGGTGAAGILPAAVCIAAYKALLVEKEKRLPNPRTLEK